jgi:hypothetical protein
MPGLNKRLNYAIDGYQTFSYFTHGPSDIPTTKGMEVLSYLRLLQWRQTQLLIKTELKWSKFYNSVHPKELLLVLVKECSPPNIFSFPWPLL